MGLAINDLPQLVDAATGAGAKPASPCYANVILNRKHDGEQA
jgi:hypothetical protein